MLNQVKTDPIGGISFFVNNLQNVRRLQIFKKKCLIAKVKKKHQEKTRSVLLNHLTHYYIQREHNRIALNSKWGAGELLSPAQYNIEFKPININS